MRYGIKYIQNGKWTAPCATLTFRGYEAWVDYPNSYHVSFPSIHNTFEDINAAFTYVSQQKSMAWLGSGKTASGFYYTVEEAPMRSS